MNVSHEMGILTIAKAAEAVGARAMLVGGCVRDKIMGKPVKDIDIEVFGIEGEALRRMLEDMCFQTQGSVDCVGESFKVLKVSWGKNEHRIEFDVSIPRIDKKIGDGHKGFEVVGNPNASFEEAARRRDFTINAIMQDALSGEIIDPFNGQQDIKDQVIRVVDPKHFAEDSLRVLRAVQFAARFGFEIEDQSSELMKTISLKDLPGERVWGEFEKLFLKADDPAQGLKVAHDLGVIDQIVPQLNPCFEYFMAKELTCKHVNRAAIVSKNASEQDKIILMLVMVSIHTHEVEKFMDSIGMFQTDIRKSVMALRDNIPSDVDKLSDGEVRRLALKVNMKMMAKVFVSLGAGREALVFMLRALEVAVFDKAPEPLLQGRDMIAMGVKPGKHMGDVLKAVFEKQLDGEVNNFEEAKAMAADMIVDIVMPS